jgi:hypothetical protein
MIQVRPVVSQADCQQFIRFPWQIYKDDPYWVPPLISQLEKRLDVHRNPFFDYAQQELFLACRQGEVVGTVAAIINHQLNQQLREQTGFFGFFEVIDDPAVAEALMSAAAGWLKQQGMKLIRGPVNGSPTDEVGLLLVGFERRPAMWEGHTPPYYRRLIETLGFHKYDDVFAYELTYDQLGGNLSNLSPKLWRVAQKAQERTNAHIRRLNLRQWDMEIAQAHYIYNTAFRSIAGHTDMSLAKFKTLADSIRPFLDPDLVLIAEVAGQAVGFAVALPDINEIMHHFNGHVSAWKLLKLHLYLRRIRTACFKLMGILPEYRTWGLEALMIVEIAKQLVKKKYQRVEMSLASEKNEAINRLVQRLGGQVYRQYRIYERSL